MTSNFDVLVVGAGPSGSSCAYWLAKEGHDVLLVERKAFPREKTCGDGLTPRSVHQLQDMGLGGELLGCHRYAGLRCHAFGRSLDLPWPTVPGLPPYGYVVTRKDLDALVARNAAKAGATLWEHTEAAAPVMDGRSLRGAQLVAKGEDGHSGDVRARYVVVADGANSRFGWAIGNQRNREYPLGMALRGYWSSPRHEEPWIDSWLDLRDESGRYMPGYGWIFPLGDGRVNVGVGLLTTSNIWKGVNTTELLEQFCKMVPQSWGIRPETALGPPTGGRLPMGLAVGPRSGPSHLVVGDASGMVNPFNGEGIAYGYETGRLAAGILHHALTAGDPGVLASYEKRIQAGYGIYYRIGRGFVQAISNPQVMRAAVASGIRCRPVMEVLLRIMSNMLRPEQLGAAEASYKALASIARRRERVAARTA
ncbi:MAG TPA: geranylgeranyl reductase family protein [Acidimicrobiales bacterium]|nr:geranylgeranyl reductase family protein [Acidimicrobiales bacterium]